MYYNNKVIINVIKKDYITGYDIYGIKYVNKKPVKEFIRTQPNNTKVETIEFISPRLYLSYIVKPKYAVNYTVAKHNIL